MVLNNVVSDRSQYLLLTTSTRLPQSPASRCLLNSTQPGVHTARRWRTSGKRWASTFSARRMTSSLLKSTWRQIIWRMWRCSRLSCSALHRNSSNSNIALQVAGFPSFRLYKKSGGELDFTGPRDLENFIKFVKTENENERKEEL